MTIERRRRFLRIAFSAAGLALTGGALVAAPRTADAKRRKEESEAEVTPGEDLMQEHGVLERILLVYDEAVRRIDRGESFDGSIVIRAAGIIRRFVEDYHEKLEEEFVFPRLQAAHRKTDLVAVLLRQHERGRQLTDEIVHAVKATGAPDLAKRLAAFNRMYRPHAAREDTVLFPSFREVVGRNGYRELGEKFEGREHELFGKRGFEVVVGEVEDLERAFDIHDLGKFTPA